MRIDDPSPVSVRAGGEVPSNTTQLAQAPGFTRAYSLAKAAQETAANDGQGSMRTLKANDTLTLIVRQEATQRGVQLSPQQEFQAVMSVAKDNKLANPDRIWAGQRLNLAELHAQLDQMQGTGKALASPSLTANATINPAIAATVSTQDILRTVKSNDTLTQIVRQEATNRGVQLSQAQVYKEVLALAKDNQLSNPNQIWPGQQLKLNQLQANLSVAGATPPGASASMQGDTSVNPNTSNSEATTSAAASNHQPHSVLRQTLDRAVERGFIPANEKQDVYNKILQVATKHRFSPDDFARLTLMESDGMNPQATNQRCHGIIQFCEGPSQGAAGVGYGQAPKAILNLSVYQQLHLVDTYFDKIGLKKQGQVQLDELYLAVLQPAARAETRPEVPLEIPGSQAHALYEGRNPQAAITRNSIIQGLLKNTMDRLGMSGKPSPAKVSSSQSRAGTSSSGAQPVADTPESL
jgi:nucleoid-associated protein YgaU